MKARTSAVLSVLLMLLSTVPMVDASDYDSDGTPDSSDTDDDNDGVLDSLDSCSTGTMNWTSNSNTDRDGDGCKDMNSLVYFEDTEDWSYQNFSFTILPGQEFEIWHICSGGCMYETTITMTKPDTTQVFWGHHEVYHPADGEYVWTSTFLDHINSRGHLSQFEGITENGVTYGDPNNIGNWSDPGTYSLNLTDLNEDYHENGIDEDNGGISIYVYLVGDDDAEDLDDDGDTKLDYLDACMIGEMNWTSNFTTDIDDDGCRDGTEDDDDDNDGWKNEFDECTNRVPTITEGPGSVIYDLASNLSDSLGNAGDAIFYDFTGVNVSGYDSDGYPIIDENQSFGGDWGITPNFTVIENEPAIQFEGFNGLELPLGANSGIDVSDSVRYNFQFYLNDTYFNNTHPTANISSSNFEGLVGQGMRTLISNHENYLDQRGLGFSMRIVPQTHNGGWNDIYPNDATFRLELIISQPPDNHYLVTKIIDNLHFQEWHNVSLTFKFTDNPTVDVIVGTKLSTYDFSDTIPDLDCWKSNLLENPLRFGADHTNTTMWSDSGDCDLPGYDRDVRCRPVIETYFSSIEILSPIPAGNPNTVNSALYLLKENLYNNISLSYNQKNSLVEQFIKNWDGNWNANSASVINFINAYSETKSAIFDLVSVDSPAWTPSAGSKSFVYDVVNSTASWEYESSHERYVAYLLQVWIHMYLFEEPFFSEAEGIAYKDAEEFPGIVKEGAPRIDSTNVTIRGTYLTDPGRSFGDDGRLIQPTGLWAPAGELVTIKVDSNVAGQGLEAWVGAHHFDLKGSTDIEASASSYARFPVISKKFGILNNETIIASPFGGAIYIEVPAGSDLGLINITIEDAVRGSLFSTRYFNETNLDDWNQSITQADTPWVDIISDKFMVSLPTPFVNFTKQLYCKISPQDADQDCTFNSQSDNLTIHITRDNCLSGSLIIEYPNGSNEEFSCTIDPDDEDHMQLQFPVLGNDGASSIHIEQQGTYTITSNIVYEYEEDGSAVGGTIIAAHLDRNTPLDPTEILRLWDLTADAFLIAGGWPVERGDALQHLWILPDLQSHPGTMAPAANPMSMGTEVSQSQAYGKFSEGVTDLQLIDNFDDEWWNPLTVTRHQYTSPNPEIGIVYHEWGHMHNYPTLWSEVENIANFPGLVIFSHAFNYSLDDSLKFSTFQELDRNESINNWMITSNFREGQRIGEGYAGYTDEGYPLDHVSYQSRGLGRYIDLAYLFGWEGVGSIHNQYYQRIITANAVPDVDYNLPSTNLWGTQSGILEASNPSDADFIISSSNALGWNMAPFFDFWGIIPDANTISYLSDVPVSPHVQNLLLQHRTIVLRNNSDFVDYYNSISDTIGTWQGPQIASWQSTYNQTTGNDTLSRIDGILCSYYSIHCDFDSDGLADVVIEPEWTDPCQVGYYMNSEASCVIADIGYYGIGGWSDQIPADAGYYVDSSGASSQTPCPSGTYNPNTGSTNSSACINAIPGYYVESTGSDSQTECAVGTYQPSTGQSSCLDADVGHYVDSTGSSTQNACSIGTYQPSTAQSSCLDADVGHYVDSTAATSQTACLIGTYQPSTGQSSCLDADAGYNVGSTGSTVQTECTVGTYQPFTGQSSCLDADTGYYVDSTGSNSQTECAVGTYQPSTGQSSCLDADAGYYVGSTASTSQTECAVGTYQPSTGQSSCLDADAGYYVDSTGSDSQTECAVGTYQPSTAQSSCLDADAGYYVGSTGSTVQTECAVGTYQPSTAQSSCLDADAGYYVDSTGSDSQTECAVGTYQPDIGESSCLDSDTGYYVDSTGSDSQAECTVGTYQPSTGQSSCLDSDSGYYVDSTGSDSQTECAVGTYQPSTGQTDCLDADVGHYVDSTAATSQTACLIGTYQPSTGQSSCLDADAGYYVGSTQATSQTACSLGTYQSSTGQSSCLDSDAGYYVDSIQATSQTACSIGNYQPDTGQSSCLDADAGYYVDSTQATSQTIAPSNSYTDSNSSISPTLCPEFYITLSEGSTSIDDCLLDSDSDGIIDAEDDDDDGDGIDDIIDLCPLGEMGWASFSWNDFDADGCEDETEDPDDDNDSVLDIDDAFPFDASESIDTDSDGTGDNSDSDDDGDGWSDSDESMCESDSLIASSTPDDFDDDSICDVMDEDDDGDGLTDIQENAIGTDPYSPDSDEDGVLDLDDAFPLDSMESKDTDSDGYGDNSDKFPEDSTEWIDSDGDNYGDNSDEFPDDSTEWIDSDGDGVGDNFVPEPKSDSTPGFSIPILILSLLCSLFYIRRIN